MSKTFGQQLRAQREASGTAAADLAVACGVSPTLVSLWESDERTPPHPNAVLRLASGTPRMTPDERLAEKRCGFRAERRLHNVARLRYYAGIAAMLGELMEEIHVDNESWRRLAARSDCDLAAGVTLDLGPLEGYLTRIELKFDAVEDGLGEIYDEPEDDDETTSG